MISFKQFLREMPAMVGPGVSYPQHDDYHDPNTEKWRRGREKYRHVESVGDYDIYHHHHRFGNRHTFVAVHRDTDTVHLHMTSEHPEGKPKTLSRTHNLESHEDNKFKAHRLYSLIHSRGYTIQSDRDHTKGGRHTWKQLVRKHPGMVKTHDSWQDDDQKRKTVTPDNFDSHYDNRHVQFRLGHD